jgi:Caspase domain
MINRLMLAFVALLALPGTSNALAEDRFALVLGNSKYEGVSALPNPTKDAKAVKAMLEEANFEVDAALDLGQSDMLGAVRDFAGKLSDKDKDSVALIYFAGHGIQIDGENYLIPVDAKITQAEDVPLEAVRLADVMNLMSAVPSKTKIVILDACRNDPFKEIAKSTGRGLAIVNAPEGSIVAYSTSPGSVAEDGTGSNSPFTAAFIKQAKVPGAEIGTVFQNVRLAVHQSTEGRQTPWEITALTEPFAFFPGDGEIKQQVPEKSEAEWRKDLKSRSADEAYDIVVREDNVIVYQLFLVLYPDAPFVNEITIILDRRLEMFAWFDAVRLNSVLAYEAFLARYPNSDLAPTAKRLKERARELADEANSFPDAIRIAEKPEIRTVIKEVPVEKLVTKEVIKEVPVEVIKEVKVPFEVVKEVPVEKIVVKEVPVERIVTKEVIKEVRVPVEKIVVKEVRVPVEKIVIKEVKVPVRIPCNCGGGGGTDGGGGKGGKGGKGRGHNIPR